MEFPFTESVEFRNGEVMDSGMHVYFWRSAFWSCTFYFHGLWPVSFACYGTAESVRRPAWRFIRVIRFLVSHLLHATSYMSPVSALLSSFLAPICSSTAGFCRSRSISMKGGILADDLVSVVHDTAVLSPRKKRKYSPVANEQTRRALDTRPDCYFPALLSSLALRSVCSACASSALVRCFVQ